MAETLTADRLTRRFGARAVVRAASLTLAPGVVTALLGASGVGKSTLLRMIAGLEPADEGEVRLGARVLSAPGLLVAPERRGVGVVFQDYALFPHLTAAQNVAFGLQRLAPAARRARAQAGLAAVGLALRADAFPHELSGGEQQRVALARALAPEPAVVLLDEPFSSLDPGLRAEVRADTLAAVRAAGVAALLVTHDADEALAEADQIAVMDAGAVVQCAPPETIYRAPATLAVARALGPVNVWRGGGATPFGPAPVAGPVAGAIVAARPEGLALRPDPDGPARVTAVRGAGPERFALIAPAGADGPAWRVRIGAQAWAPGARAAVAFDPAGVFAFEG